MKRFLAVAAALAFAVPATAQIATTAHDFSTELWNTTQEICAVCHTPHNADITLNTGEFATADPPLWNHAVATAGAFTPYTGYQMQATPGAPSGTSLLCLSCHDGVTAIDSYGGATGSNLIVGTANLTQDLSDDHPVGFTYVAAAGEIQATGGTNPSVTGTVDPATLLSNGNVECSSCHDVHNQGGVAGSFLLRVTRTNSALCLSCHIK